MAAPPPSLPLAMSCIQPRLQWSVDTHRYIVLFLTFITYFLYLVSRKPTSIVQSDLNPQESIHVKSVLNSQEYNHSLHYCQSDPLFPWPLGPVFIPRSQGILCESPSNDSASKGWAPFNDTDGNTKLFCLDVVFLVCYSFGSFLAGHLGDSHDLRILLTGDMIASGVLVILFGLGYYLGIHVFWFFLVVQMLSGLFQATGWPWVVAVVENWYQEQGNWGLFMGLWNPFVSMGNIVGSLLAGFALHHGWGLSFIIPGLMMIAGGLLVYFFLIPHPESIQFPNQDEETGHSQERRQHRPDEEAGHDQEAQRDKEAAESQQQSRDIEAGQNSETRQDETATKSQVAQKKKEDVKAGKNPKTEQDEAATTSQAAQKKEEAEEAVEDPKTQQDETETKSQTAQEKKEDEKAGQNQKTEQDEAATKSEAAQQKKQDEDAGHNQKTQQDEAATEIQELQQKEEDEEAVQRQAPQQERQGKETGQGVVPPQDEEAQQRNEVESQENVENGNNMNAIGRIYAACQIPGVKPYAGCLLGAKLLAYMFVAALPFHLSKNEIGGKLMSVSTAGNLSTLFFNAGATLGSICAGCIYYLFNAKSHSATGFIALAALALIFYHFYGNFSQLMNILLMIVISLSVNGLCALITTAVSADIGTHNALQGHGRALATVTAIIDGTGSVGAALGLLIGYFLKRGLNSIAVLVVLEVVAVLSVISLYSPQIVQCLKNRIQTMQNRHNSGQMEQQGGDFCFSHTGIFFNLLCKFLLAFILEIINFVLFFLSIAASISAPLINPPTDPDSTLHRQQEDSS